MRAATSMSEKGCSEIQWDFSPFPPNISEGSLRGINVNICSFIFTDKEGIAQISNVHPFSKQVSSGQRSSFGDLLLVQYRAPVFDASPEADPPDGSPGGGARRSHPKPGGPILSQEVPSRPTALQGAIPSQQRTGKDAANI